MGMRIKRIVAAFLAVTMTLSALPLTTIAETINDTAEENVGTAEELTADYEGEIQDSGDVEEAVIISELIESRTENTKEFLKSDGSKVIAVYNQAVHYQDTEGEWQEIDNSLVYESKNSQGDFSGYTNKENDFDVKFADTSKGGNLFEFEKDEYKLSWYLEGQRETKIDTSPEELSSEAASETEADGDEFTTVENLTSDLQYDNIKNNVDLHYSVESGQIKENIILNGVLPSYSFSFIIDSSNLSLVLNDDGSITGLNNENESELTIPAPFMYDKGYSFSEKVKYQLNDLSNGRYRLTVTADDEWINADERQFPVVIDPIIKVDYDNIKATTTYSASPTSSLYGMPVMNVGTTSSDDKYRSFLRFDTLPTLSKSDVVLSASLSLTPAGNTLYNSTSERVFTLHEVTSAWTPSTLTWNTMPSASTTVTDYGYIEAGYNAKYFDVTKLVKKWYSNSSSNYGIMLKSNEKTSEADGYIAFAKVNAIFAESIYPVLQINYRSNRGLEDYWSYTSFSAGDGGTAYINDFSGNLVFVNTDLAETGNRMPVSISHI